MQFGVLFVVCWTLTRLATGQSANRSKINNDSLFTSSSDLTNILNPHFPYFSQFAETCSGSGSENTMPDSYTDEKLAGMDHAEELAGMDHAEVHYFNRCIFSHVLPVPEYTLNIS